MRRDARAAVRSSRVPRPASGAPPGYRAATPGATRSPWSPSARRWRQATWRSAAPLGNGRALASCVRRPCGSARSEEHTSELQSQFHLVCRLQLEKKKKKKRKKKKQKKKKKKLKDKQKRKRD